MKQKKAFRLYKLSGNIGLFYKQEFCQKLSEIDNPLDMISKVLGFKLFRHIPEDKLLNHERKILLIQLNMAHIP